MPKVFISYSREDEEWKRRLHTQLAVLEREGLLSVWEDRQIEEGEAWYPEIEKALNEADVAILLISADFLVSNFILGEEIPRLLERREKEGVRVIPLILRPCPWWKVKWLSALQGASRGNVALSGLSEYEQDKALSRLAERVHDLLETDEGGSEPTPKHRQDRPAAILIDRLPTVAGGFFGRELELKLLDDALAGDDTRIVQFVAAGGTGKTKLLRHWLNRHERDIPNRIVWSFYSQGSSEDSQVSASPLFTEGFKAFGVDPAVFKTEEERADAFAERLMEHRCLLVLDGLEPLQHGGRGMDGRIKDRAVPRLLKRLAQQHTGLCIITTRIRVHDLHDLAHVLSHPLDNLATADGVRLLDSLGARGPATAMEEAVEEAEGHALTLHLLGNAIGTYLDGDIRKRDTLEALIDDFDDQGRHAFKVMQAYRHWLTDADGQPLAELQLLYLLGLFDHPVETGVLGVLWEEQIPGLTGGIPERAWRIAIRDLRDRHHLLSRHAGRPELLDCHPLIREYFGRELQKNRPEAWRQAHERLYEYYRGLPERERPDTLEGMQPLFSAVAHGCAAGLHQRALDEVYYPRIQRDGKTNYLSAQLGAFSDDLAVVAHFFTTPWCTPASGLKKKNQATVLNWAGYRLRALGRLREAMNPMRAATEMVVEQENWVSAASGASSLSELQLTLGDVSEAIQTGQRSVDYADRSGDLDQRMVSRTTHADALHQAGDADAALALFQEAERLQQGWWPAYSRLYSLPGFRYCDLLLARGGTVEVLERTEQALQWAKRYFSLLDVALNQLTFGRTYLQQGDYLKAAHWLGRAVAGLRAAGQQDDLPRGLLTRAALYRQTGDFPRAHRDLQEVFDIAVTSKMRLHLTDYHLGMARLLLAEDRPGEARRHTDTAGRLIEATGYKRRLPELAELGSGV